MGRASSLSHICIPCNIMAKGIKNHFNSKHPDLPMVLEGATQTSCLFCGNPTEYAPTLRDHRMYCSKSCKRRHENEDPELEEGLLARAATIRYPRYLDDYWTYVCQVQHENMTISTLAGNEYFTFGALAPSSDFNPEEEEKLLQHNFSLLKIRSSARESVPYHAATYKEFLNPTEIKSPLRIGTRDVPAYFELAEEHIKSIQGLEWYVSFGTRWVPQPQYIIKTRGQYPRGIRVYKNKDQFKENVSLPEDPYEIDSTSCYIEKKSLKWE